VNRPSFVSPGPDICSLGPRLSVSERFSVDADNVTTMRDEMFRAVMHARSAWTAEEGTAMAAKIRSALNERPFFARCGSAVESSGFGL
jgi:hypothetical protein